MLHSDGLLWIVLLFLSSSQAAVILRNPDDFGGALTFQNQDVLGQYDFGYNEGHPSGASFRRESGDAYGNKVGAFGLRDADGRVRVVRYVADENGFRAEVTSNEPGVAPQDPASATINKPAVVAAPVVAYPPPPPPAPVAYGPPPKAYPPPPPPPPAAVYNYPPPPPPAAVYNYPPPPPPVAVPQPPPVYNYAAPYAGPVKVPVPPPGPVAVPYPPPVQLAPLGTPVAVAPAPAKGIPPPPGYYANVVVPGKEVVGVLRYPSLVPPFAAVPPQFGYLTVKSPPYYQPLGSPL